MKVRPTLQLASYDNIYAAGDIVDYPEEKQLLTANAHSRVIIANIMAAISRKPLRVYNGSPVMILLTNGKVSYSRYLTLHQYSLGISRELV